MNDFIYFFQEKNEINKANELNAARLYNEILKIDKNNSIANQGKVDIVKKYNNNVFEVSPFEVGILFKNGYVMVIPAFEKLPFTISKTGKTVEDSQTQVLIQIQKFDIVPKTIIKLSLQNMSPSPAGSEKIEHVLNLEKTGVLKVVCKEIGGNYRVVTAEYNLRNWL